jgi:hypothetical protein
VKKFSKVKSTIGPLKDSNGNFISDSKDMANILKEQYSSVFRIPLSEAINPKLLFNIQNDPSKLSDISFSPADIIWAIEEISPNSAPGASRSWHRHSTSSGEKTLMSCLTHVPHESNKASYVRSTREIVQPFPKTTGLLL